MHCLRVAHEFLPAPLLLQQGMVVTHVSCGWWHTAAVARVARGRRLSLSSAAMQVGGINLLGICEGHCITWS